MTPDAIWRLPTQTLGQRVEVYAEVESTNSLALSHGDDPGQAGRVFLARTQSAGRGQYGRSWVAPPGSSTLLSVLLFPPTALRRPVLLTAGAAVAVTETILALTGQHATIKWPNDVLLNGKKVCGILIEQRNTAHPEQPLAAVIGMGLNVAQPESFFRQAGLPLAGSLLSVTGQLLDVDETARSLLTYLDNEVDSLYQGETASLESRWRDRLGVVGQWVQVETIDQPLVGRVTALSFTALTLELAPGQARTLALEAIRHITPA